MSVLKPGDLVVLKSGGPVMTVDTVNTDIFDDDKITGVLCAWFVGTKLERARFDRNAIVAALAQEGASESAEPRLPEASDDYKTVLDEMAAAMNDPVEAPREASRATHSRPRRSSNTKDAAEVSVPIAPGIN